MLVRRFPQQSIDGLLKTLRNFLRPPARKPHNTNVSTAVGGSSLKIEYGCRSFRPGPAANASTATSRRARICKSASIERHT